MIEEDVRFDEMGKTRLTTFSQLISYLEFKLLDQNDGEGDPNTAAAYRTAVEWLYSTSYAMKFAAKAALRSPFPPNSRLASAS